MRSSAKRFLHHIKNTEKLELDFKSQSKTGTHKEHLFSLASVFIAKGFAKNFPFGKFEVDNSLKSSDFCRYVLQAFVGANDKIFV